MPRPVTPTERELEILKVLWERGEATVRDVYEELRERLPIVQNTVQAFLRTMEEKGLVEHRLEGRTFVYQPLFHPRETKQHLAEQLLQRAFDGAIDQLVQSVLDLRKPTSEELARLEELIAKAWEDPSPRPSPRSTGARESAGGQAKAGKAKSGKKKESP